jgi:hypothetical protein
MSDVNSCSKEGENVFTKEVIHFDQPNSNGRIKRILAWNIYTAKLDISDDYLMNMKTAIYSLVNNCKVTETGKTTFHDRIRIQDIDFFKPLINVIIEHASKYRNVMNLQVSKIWVTVASPGSFHQVHTHGNSLISGVFYVNVPGNNLTLDFRNNTINWFEKCYSEPIETKKLILFEGWMQHGFKPVRGNEDKIAIAFNIDKVPNFYSKPRQGTKVVVHSLK